MAKEVELTEAVPPCEKGWLGEAVLERAGKAVRARIEREFFKVGLAHRRMKGTGFGAVC